MEKNIQVFASKGAGISGLDLLDKHLKKNIRIDKTSLDRWLSDPIKFSNNLKDLSKKMLLTNGMLKEIILYKSYFLTNDHWIYPCDTFKYKDKDKMLKDMVKVAQYLELFNIKTILPIIMKSLYENGEIYLYKLEQKNTIFFQEIPSNLCKSLTIDEYGIPRYGINIKELDVKYLSFFPIEIQNAHKKYTNAKDKKNIKGFSGDYYLVSDSGVCFKFNQLDVKGVPYYAHLFKSLLNLSEAEDLDTESNSIENYKLLHQLAPVDSQGRPLIDSDIVEAYHNSIKSTIPTAVGVVTTPMDIKPITLADSKLKNYEYINNIKKNVYDNSGISDDLFNGNSNNKEAIILSSLIDTSVSLSIQRMMQNYINYELGKKFRSCKWKIDFVESNLYNKEKIINLERQNLTVFSSKFKYLATLGLTPLQAINVIWGEELLGITEHMLPMMTSHTMSGKDKQNDSPASLENGKVEEDDLDVELD